MNVCLTHPEIQLPDKLTCPLCAQESRRAAYAVQKAAMSEQMRWAVQGLLKPAEDAP